MFEEMVVRFSNANRKLEAVIAPPTDIIAVFLPGQSGADLATRFGLKHRPNELEPSITLRDENGNTVSALSAAPGPGMCCIKGGDLFCW